MMTPTLVRADRRLISWATLRELVHFAWTSGAGLVVDLGLFTLLVSLGSSGFRANLASSSMAIAVAYLLVSRFSFRASPTWRTYGLFTTWYAGSATLVSLAIHAISNGDRGIEVLVKCCSVPVTFATNYLFGRWLFSGGAERTLRHVRLPEVRPLKTASQVIASRPDLVVAVLVAAWFVVLVMPVTERIAFVPPPDPGSAARRVLLHLLFGVALVFVVRFAIRFAQQLQSGSRRHRRWLAVSAATLATNAVLLLLIWPGYWVFDEFGTLQMVRSYADWAWQGYLTNVYYTLSLLLIPTSIGIVIVQLTFAALVSGYLISALAERLANPRFAVVLALPLLALPTLLDNTYPLRLTAYAYLLALTLCRLLVAASDRRDAAPAELVGFSVAVAVLAFWRTEGIFMLLLIPVYLRVGAFRSVLRRRRGAAVAALTASIAAVIASGSTTVATADPRYQVTAYINPLSTMLQQPLRSPHLAEDLQAIDAVIPLSALQEFPSYVEVPAMWNVGVRDGFESHLAAMRTAYVDLVTHNPQAFLSNRLHALAAANSMQPDYLSQPGGGVFNRNEVYLTLFAEFQNENAFAMQLDPALRQRVVAALLLTDGPQSSLGTTVVWNALPAVAASIAVMVWSLLRRRRWIWAACAGTVVAHATLVFLTTPGAYFMYYFPAYLVGGLLTAAAAAVVVDRAVLRRRLRAFRPGRAPESSPTGDPRPVLALARQPRLRARI